MNNGRPDPAAYNAAAAHLRAHPEKIDHLLGRATPCPETGCLLWTGAVNNKGYATANVGGDGVAVHRLVYALAHGDPGAQFDCDHICSVRSCIALAHLRPLTHLENVRAGKAKKTHCKRGHPLSGDNMAPTRAGSRSRCAACIVLFVEKREAERRAILAMTPKRPPPNRKTVCCRGHALTEENRMPTASGSRCRLCARLTRPATKTARAA